jgi:hypothetical protein
LNGALLRVAQVKRSATHVAVHQSDQPVDQVIHVLEGPRLLSITINGDGLALQRLDNKVADDAPVVRMHTRSESVEDASDAHINVLLFRT